jgi:hypothetical protein
MSYRWPDALNTEFNDNEATPNLRLLSVTVSITSHAPLLEDLL